MGTSIVPMVMMNSCASSGKAALVDIYLLVNNTFVMGISIVPMVMMNSCATSGKAALVDSYLLVNNLCDGYQHCPHGDDEQLCFFR